MLGEIVKLFSVVGNFIIKTIMLINLETYINIILSFPFF